MRVYTTKEFRRIARRLGIDERALSEAIARAEKGLIDADYRGGVIKQRIPRDGQGRRAGYRTLVVFKAGHRAVFLDALAKNEEANFDDALIEAYRKAAKLFLGFSNQEVAKLIEAGDWKEVDHG